jgi:hypothetical protein
MGLRTKSVFEILERGAAAGDHTLAPEELAKEIDAGAACLSRREEGIPRKPKTAGQDSGSRILSRAFDDAFATWQTGPDDPGRAWRIALKAALEGLGYRCNDLAHYDYDRQSGCGERTTRAIDASLSACDKIQIYRVRHLLDLEAFPGATGLRAAYRARIADNDPPWPHVLREEDNAAKLEGLSTKLVGLGYLGKPLDQMAPAEVALCADMRALAILVTCMSADLVDWRSDEHEGKEAWMLHGIPTDAAGSAAARILSEQRGFSAAIKELTAGREGAAIDARVALHTTASSLLQESRAVDHLKAFAASGWESHPDDLAGGVDELFRAVAASVAARIAGDISLDEFYA